MVFCYLFSDTAYRDDFIVTIIYFSSSLLLFPEVAFKALCLKKCIGIYPNALLLSQDTFEW